MKVVPYLVLIVTLFFGCGRGSEGLQRDFMPVARGEIGEIILVMDSLQWEGKLGDEIKGIFREPMQGLPQDEPMFSLSKASPKRINSVLKSATNMVFVMTLDSKTTESAQLRGYFTNQSLKTIQSDSSQFMIVHRDEFARGQVVLYLFSSSEEHLIRKLSENRTRIQEFFESNERTRLKEQLYKSREKGLEKAIAEDHPFSLQVPFGWDLARSEPGFFWMRFLEADKEQNVFVHYQPYTDAAVFDDIARYRDQITEKYLVDSEKPTVYITRQVRDDIRGVTIDNLNFDGHYAVRLRGLWKISDNSGGGPYLAYVLVDEPSQMLYYIEGYVYAPSTKKKNYIREVDAILSTFSPATIK
ncbi:MAG: DUF4837 family protein [Cyclobacteriaceae bacterium]|nr:DUF4837 family protein [Cyclobacteriaceae bacterium]